MNSTLTPVERNPLAIRGAVTAAVTAVVHLGVVLNVIPIDDAAEREVTTTVDALGFLVLILWARKSVTPNAKVIARVTTTGEVVAGDAAERVTGAAIGVDDVRGIPVTEPIVVRPELVDSGPTPTLPDPGKPTG